jgi:hypothetical protein
LKLLLCKFTVGNRIIILLIIKKEAKAICNKIIECYYIPQEIALENNNAIIVIIQWKESTKEYFDECKMEN